MSQTCNNEIVFDVFVYYNLVYYNYNNHEYIVIRICKIKLLPKYWRLKFKPDQINYKIIFW